VVSSESVAAQFAALPPRMKLLIDENVPNSVAEFFISRGHEIQYVREVLAGGTPDPLIAKVGDSLSAIVVTWDRDFERVVRRVPDGNKAAFRKLGRISFRCNETRGRALLERWIVSIEAHYERCLEERDFRMIVQIQREWTEA
jgi:predicted nuclease of predicted toxin-antitoxin system